MTNNPYAPARPQSRWKPSVLFWIVAAVLLLVLISFAVAGGIAAVFAILGLVALLTGLYTLLFNRRSWVGLPHRKSGGLVAASGVAALIVGAGVAGATAPPRTETSKATEVSTVQPSATATATPTPTPTATNPANTTCATAADTRKYNGETLVCTQGSDQRLVWMSEDDSKRVLAEKAAADKAAADKAAADKAAADKAAADKAVADKAAADKAAADKAAADKAAAGTVSQRNALRKAADYLKYTAFSRTGLIGQLEYEKYSTEDATWAVDRVTVDWNQQAAKKAKDYLKYTSFSRSGLVDQLLYEGYTPEQAEYGVSQTGL